MPATNRELLESAIACQSLAVISNGDGLARREMMVQFVEISNDKKNPGLWASVQEGDLAFIEQAIHSAKPMSLWFQSDLHMLHFESSLLKLKRIAFTKRRMLLISWPQAIEIVEERHQPRRWVPENFKISGRLQVLTPNRHVAHECNVRIWDLGLEGASLVCPADACFLSLDRDAWIKLIICRDGQEFAYPGTYRHMTRLSEEKLRLGVQFFPSGDPAAAGASDALRVLVNELSKSNTAAPRKSAA
jgi:hypothetical protein